MRPRLLAPLLLLAALAGCATQAPTATLPPAADAPEVLESRLTPPDLRASEVAIAANPLDPAHLVAAANSMGGFGVYVTRDAGATWDASHFSAAQVDPRAPGVPRFRSLSDPAVAFGPDGALYLAGLAYVPTSAVFVARSADGGTTWDDARVVHESDPATSFNDKEWIGVSPVTGTIVVAWQKELVVDQLRAVEERTGLDLDFGDVVVSRSADGGRTWSPPVQASAGRHNNGTQVAFTADGRAHLLWVDYEKPALAYAASEDDGRTWSAPRHVVDVTLVKPYPRFARMHTLPGMAAAPAGEALHVVWHDAREGDADVFAVASPDGGRTWGPPARVNDDPRGNGAIQLFPAVAVAPDGSVHATFYDARDDPGHPRFRYAHARAEGPGAPFGPTRPVSGEAFTAFDQKGLAPGQPDRERRSLGDYTGVAATSRGVFPAWADGRGEAEAVWAARVAPQA